jgi:hypothetical protein
MVNIVEFAQVLDLLDHVASPAIVNRALREVRRVCCGDRLNRQPKADVNMIVET